MNGRSAFDWPHLMRLGLGLLRLPPGTFWDMTPLELSASLEGAAGAFGAPASHCPMSREEFLRLAARWPDAAAEKERRDG